MCLKHVTIVIIKGGTTRSTTPAALLLHMFLFTFEFGVCETERAFKNSDQGEGTVQVLIFKLNNLHNRCIANFLAYHNTIMWFYQTSGLSVIQCDLQNGFVCSACRLSLQVQIIFSFSFNSRFVHCPLEALIEHGKCILWFPVVFLSLRKSHRESWIQPQANGGK